MSCDIELVTAGMHDIAIDMHVLIWQNSVNIVVRQGSRECSEGYGLHNTP